MLSLALLYAIIWPGRTLLFIIAFLFVLFLLRQAWKKTPRERRGRRLLLGAVIAVYISSPYIAYKAGDLRFAFSRIPEPLHSMWIEYRQEELFGLGFLPGDNETGFVVYRLTDASARWARDQGSKLGAMLSDDAANWQPTPVGRFGDGGKWPRGCRDDPNCHDDGGWPSITGYLGKYGFSIPLADDVETEANRAIRSEGSYYRYGRGGSVTIVDPGRGKVYFAYAG